MLDLNHKNKIRSKNVYEFIDGISQLTNVSKERKKEMLNFVYQIFVQNQTDEKDLITLENGIVVDGASLQESVKEIESIKEETESVPEETKNEEWIVKVESDEEEEIEQEEQEEEKPLDKIKALRRSLSNGNIKDDLIFDSGILEVEGDFSDFSEDEKELNNSQPIYTKMKLNFLRQDSKLNLRKLLMEKQQDAVRKYQEKKKELKEKVFEKVNEIEEIYGDQIEKLVETKDLITEKVDEAVGIVVLTFEEFVSRAMNHNDFLNCFGLFEKINEPILNIETLIEKKFDIFGIEFKYDRPSFVGELCNASSGRKRIARVLNGFLEFYQGKDAKQDLLNNKPSRVLNLQDASVCKWLNVDSKGLFAFSISIDRPQYLQSFCVDKEEDVEKWIWILRRNTGYQRYKYQSTFKPKIQNSCDFFISGKSYFEDLSKSIQSAKSQILICGWMISPHLSLEVNSFSFSIFQRNGKNVSFADLLEERAKNGVLIYVLVWADPQNSLLIDLGSSYVEQYLSKLHKNIYVIRDPTYTGSNFDSQF
jgi:hypothetical protein